MDKENKRRLKKYLFMISMFFIFVTGGHIGYVYIYDGAQHIPTQGGSISQGVIGDIPHLNPLLASNDYNKYISYLLYRSLLKYDATSQEIVGDLATCDTQSLGKIECFLNDNSYWSDGSPITGDDIVATYNLLQNSDINLPLKKLIKETTIEHNNGAIIFKNEVEDVNFINALFQPIVAKKILDDAGNKELHGEFSARGGLYSGPYEVDTISYDESSGIQKLILKQNPYYTQKEILVSSYIFRIFKDENHFLKHKDLVGVYFDKNKIIGDSVPRLSKHKYSLNKYNALFLNESKLKSRDFRSFIFSKIDIENMLKLLGNSYDGVDNLFFDESDVQTYPGENTNLESMLQEMGYFKKDALLEHLTQQKERIETQDKIENTPLEYLNKPFTKKYNFTQETDILLEGSTKGKSPDAVYINDYRLTGFKSGDTNFYYRIKTEFNNILAGENNYIIYFEKDGKKEKVEELQIVYSSQKDKLDRLQKLFEENVLDPNQEPEKLDDQKAQEILDLDDKWFYNANLEKFVLRFYYVDSKDNTFEVANMIKNSLESYNIEVQVTPIGVTELSEEIKTDKTNYDMLLVGIDVGYFPFYLYPYLHSTQVEDGYNFASIKNFNLDTLLLELKSHILSKQKTKELENKMTEILNEKQIIRPLYTKKENVLIDTSIQNFELPSHIMSDTAVIDALLSSYTAQEKQINFENKNLSDFIDFIKKVFSHE